MSPSNTEVLNQTQASVAKEVKNDLLFPQGEGEDDAFYHSLPSLGEALDSISKVNFDQVLAKITQLLIPYGDKFGLALVHRHFDIFTNELMVEDGLIMKPFVKSGNTDFFEKRWNRDGKVYEYSTTKQEPIPEKLLQDFREIIPDALSLGLYSRSGDDETGQWMETTHPDNRSHIDIPKTDEYKDAPETAWFSKDGAPLTRGCGKTCTESVLRSNKVIKHVTTYHKKL